MSTFHQRNAGTFLLALLSLTHFVVAADPMISQEMNPAILGGFTLVHQFSRIGAHSFSGMGSVINKDVPPFVLVSGHYAESKGINKQGLKRRGYSVDEISALQKSYKRLVRRKGVIEEKVFEEVQSLAEQYSGVREMVDFVRTAERGTVS